MHTYTYIYMFQYSSERLTQIARREMINRAKFYIYIWKTTIRKRTYKNLIFGESNIEK